MIPSKPRHCLSVAVLIGFAFIHAPSASGHSKRGASKANSAPVFSIEITTFKGEEISNLSLRSQGERCEVKSDSTDWISIERTGCDRARALSEKVAKVENTLMTPHESHLRIAFKSNGKEWIKQTPLRLVKSCDRNDVCTESGGEPSPAMKELNEMVAGILKK